MELNCFNRLKFYGDADEIAKFREQGDDGSGGFSFDNFRSEPNPLRRVLTRKLKKGAVARDENWSSPDIFDVYFHENWLEFDTEEALPINTFLAISKKFPKLIFMFSYQIFAYRNRNFSDCGNLLFANGIVVAEEYKNKTRVGIRGKLFNFHQSCFV